MEGGVAEVEAASGSQSAGCRSQAFHGPQAVLSVQHLLLTFIWETIKQEERRRSRKRRRRRGVSGVNLCLCSKYLWLWRD